MAEMPPLFYASPDGILPHNPLTDVLPKAFLLPTMVTGTKLPFGWAKAMINRNSLWKIMYSSHILQVRSAKGYYVFLPHLPGMVKAELPGTYKGWLVWPIQTFPNSPSSLMENHWALIFRLWLLSISTDGYPVQPDSSTLLW